QRGIQRHPSSIGDIRFGPSVGSLAPDNLFQLGLGILLVLRHEVTRYVARRNSTLAQDTQQKMREVLADAGSQLQGIRDRRVHVSCAFHVLEALMDQVGSSLRESGDRAVT